MQYLRRYLALSLLTAIGLILGLLISEITLRVAGYSAPLFREASAVIGWTLRPGLEGYHRKETINFVKLNQAGFHDLPHSKTKLTDSTRIAFLGDSFTYAAEVPQEANFTSLLETTYPVSETGRTESLNFGVVGYGTTQQLIQLRTVVWDYSPDIVALVLYLGNDITDNHPTLAESLKNLRPYFSLNDTKLVQLDGYPKKSLIAQDNFRAAVVNSSRVLQLFKQAAFVATSGGFKKFIATANTHPKYERFRYLYMPPSLKEKAWVDAWCVTEALVAQMHREVREHSAKFLLIIAPEPIRANPNADVQDAFKQKLGVSSLDYGERRLMAWAHKNQIPTLNLGPELGVHAQANGEYLHGFGPDTQGEGHWNKVGHQRVAQLVSKALKSL